MNSNNIFTCVRFPHHDQPGLNLLVHFTGIPVFNLTLNPPFMESTWAGSYKDDQYQRFWSTADKIPYLIHWAGLHISGNSPIDELFLVTICTPTSAGSILNHSRIRENRLQKKYDSASELSLTHW